jgi:hypothetical protein
MKEPINKRSIASRNGTEAGIACRPYASSGAVYETDGIMRNFSRQGSYIETTQKFEAGSILIVRMVDCLPPSLHPADQDQPRSICLAEVKWQREMGDELALRYGIGLRYLD